MFFTKMFVPVNVYMYILCNIKTMLNQLSNSVVSVIKLNKVSGLTVVLGNMHGITIHYLIPDAVRGRYRTIRYS